MLARVQTHTDVSKYSLYHQYLIKVLVEEELGKRNQTWDQFLFYRAGQPAPTPPVPQPNPQPAKRRTKRKAKKENIYKKAKGKKEKVSTIKYERKLEKGESSLENKPKSMKIVPPVPPFPNVYTTARRGSSATTDKSKA